MAIELSRRGAVAGLLAVAVPSILRARNLPRRTRVLFVCRYGSVKSPIARELLKRRAAIWGVPIDVSARGIQPEAHLPAALKRTLAKDRIDTQAEPLQKLKNSDIKSADIVVFFDQLPPGSRPKSARDWTDLASMLNSYASSRADLDARIESLVRELAAPR